MEDVIPATYNNQFPKEIWNSSKRKISKTNKSPSAIESIFPTNLSAAAAHFTHGRKRGEKAMLYNIVQDMILYLRSQYTDNLPCRLCDALNFCDIHAELINGQVVINRANVREPIRVQI